MRTLALTFLFLILCIASSNAIPQKNTAGFPALGEFLSKQTLTSDQKIVGMTGFYGQDQPKQWLILVKNTKTGRYTEYAFSDHEVEATRSIPRNAALPSIEIDTDRLKVDSDTAFDIGESLANTAGIGYDSVHYQLRSRESGEEPVWMVKMLGPKGKSIGIHYISAESGQILRSNWHRSSPTSFTLNSSNNNQVGERFLYGGDKIAVTTKSSQQKRVLKRTITPSAPQDDVVLPVSADPIPVSLVPEP